MYNVGMGDIPIACEDKLVFDTKDAAEKAAAVAKYQHNASLKPYLCDICGYWHLASDYS